MYIIIIKTLLLYLYIIICYRIMGKKEVGKLSIIDLIVSILIAEIAAMSIEEKDSSILISIIPITILTIIQIVFSYLSLKSDKFRKLVDGNPTLIINKGKINFKEMSKLRYSLDDLVSQLREQKIKSIEEVNYAILENNGKLSVFTDNDDYPLPIIVDGIINYQTLNNINKDMKWLNKALNKLQLSEVFYAFYKKDKLYIIRKLTND